MAHVSRAKLARNRGQRYLRLYRPPHDERYARKPPVSDIAEGWEYFLALACARGPTGRAPEHP